MFKGAGGHSDTQNGRGGSVRLKQLSVFRYLRQPHSATTLKKWRGEESPSVLRRRGCQDLITEKGLNQQEVSQILGIDEAKISNLKNGRLQKFSLEQMFSFLVALGQNIEILVTPQAVANSSVSIQVMYRNKS